MSSDLLEWFKSEDGALDTSSIGFTEFPGQGLGAVALKDVPEGHVLFAIPRGLTLSTRTSSLPSRLGKEAWTQFGLDKGWTGLILCMMWEEAQGGASKWATYLSSLPSSFDTPMFWSAEDLKELAGTAVVDKIGKDDAERDHKEKVVPTIESRPDLFPESTRQPHYSLERYHIMGNRILSRSFQVEPWINDEGQAGVGEGHDEATDAAGADAMDVDSPPHGIEDSNPTDEAELIGDTLDGISDDDDDDDAESSADVAMVPMADMLNARYGSENAKLFHEPTELRMITTKPIKAGEQIWNTYGDLPNSDLLRRYGHVDLVSVPDPLGGIGNPADIVEIRGDVAVAVATQDPAALEERVDWWLENADVDTFVVGTDCELPEELVSFVRLLLMSTEEWEKTNRKGKLPKPKVDIAVLDVIENMLTRRLKDYPSSVEEDEELLKPEIVTLNKKHALIVRIGEKKILQGTQTKVRAVKEGIRLSSQANANGKKRAREVEVSSSGRGKKSKH